MYSTIIMSISLYDVIKKGSAETALNNVPCCVYQLITPETVKVIPKQSVHSN